MDVYTFLPLSLHMSVGLQLSVGVGKYEAASICEAGLRVLKRGWVQVAGRARESGSLSWRGQDIDSFPSSQGALYTDVYVCMHVHIMVLSVYMCMCTYNPSVAAKSVNPSMYSQVRSVHMYRNVRI